MSTRAVVQLFPRRVVLDVGQQSMRLAIVHGQAPEVRHDLYELALELGCADCLVELDARG